MPITPDTVTVLGHRVKASDPMWTGLDWTRGVTVRQQVPIMAYLLGKAVAPVDHHLGVPWMHPDDRATVADDPDYWAIYRVRSRRKKYRFEPAPGEPTGWRLVDPRQLTGSLAPKTQTANEA